MILKLAAPALIISLSLLAGCSSSDDDDGGMSIVADTPDTEDTLPTDAPDNSDQTSMPAPGSDPGDAPQGLSRYNGNYIQNCFQDEDDIWTVFELSIQGTTATSIVSEYSDSECTQLFETTIFDTSIDYPGGTVSTPLGNADFIDVTLESVTINGQNFSVADEMAFDIILLDGINLHFGLITNELDGESAATRHNELDLEEVFIRL